MSRFRIALLIALVTLAAGCAGRTEGETGLAGASSVRFVVMGDNQPEGTGTLGQPDVFKQIVREVNRLQPALVVNCGDHISGYTDDVQLIHRMWDEYFEADAAYTMPSYHAPGNHDVWDDRSEALFRERVGKLYYSFDQGNCHFIVLDSEDRKHPQQIAGQQLGWLKSDLAAKRIAVIVEVRQ